MPEVTYRSGMGGRLKKDMPMADSVTVQQKLTQHYAKSNCIPIKNTNWGSLVASVVKNER